MNSAMFIVLLVPQQDVFHSCCITLLFCKFSSHL